MTLLRAPRLRVLADGYELAGLLSAEITSNNHYAADCFSVRLALSADPGRLSAWDGRTNSLIDVQIAFDAVSGWTTLVTGRADSIDVDPIAGLLVVEGRDLSAALIEARTREAFSNHTSSEIAIELAGRHGLTPLVVPTTTPVGRYYSSGHERITLDRYSRAGSEWDLLVWLAQLEGFDVFVIGTNLSFQPVGLSGPPIMVLRAADDSDGPANVLNLHLHRALTLSGDISVTIKSWNSQSQRTCIQTARRTGDGDAAPRNYIYTRPNLSPDEASQLAQRKLSTLVRHEFELTATMPGELALAPRSLVALAGTGSIFDQGYVIDEIARSIDARRGFTQIVRARAAGSVPVSN